MPWVAHAPDAGDDHKMWTHPGSDHERVLRHIGWTYEVPAPGAEPPDEQDDEQGSAQEPPAEAPAVQVPVVEQPAPDQIKPKGQRRAAVGRKS